MVNLLGAPRLVQALAYANMLTNHLITDETAVACLDITEWRVWTSSQNMDLFYSYRRYLRVLLGAGEAPFYPSGVRRVREWFTTDTRGRATAVMSMSQTLGLAVAPHHHSLHG
jgi:hypothetical protein